MPSLKISHQVLFFKATTPGDEAQHVICISNESCMLLIIDSQMHFSQFIYSICIGESHMFEFGSSENIPIHFSPKMYKLSPKQVFMTSGCYSSRLIDSKLAITFFTANHGENLL